MVKTPYNQSHWSQNLSDNLFHDDINVKSKCIFLFILIRTRDFKELKEKDKLSKDCADYHSFRINTPAKPQQSEELTSKRGTAIVFSAVSFLYLIY